MGQSESVAAAGPTTNDPSPLPPPPPPLPPSSTGSSPSSPPSFEKLVAEATNFGGNDENESLDVKAQKALECPCVAQLRKGPCGTSFSEAFVCFLKSTLEEKGSDCVSPFIALQNCIKANPDAFSKNVLEDEGEEDGEEDKNIKMIPPTWARETKSKSVSKL